MATIKEIVNTLEIPKKRKKAALNRAEIVKCNVAMSNMCFMDKHVAMYADDLGKLQILLAQNDPANLDEIKRIREEMTKLEKCKGVREYQFVLDYKLQLEDQVSEYYRTIQVDLREELINQSLPEFYVYQGVVDPSSEIQFSRHLIIPNTSFTFTEPGVETTIYPESQKLASNRSARHFYNQVSFKYLEQLTEDCSYELEGKKLGKVKVLPKS